MDTWVHLLETFIAPQRFRAGHWQALVKSRHTSV
jgi:hypothetical protein